MRKNKKIYYILDIIFAITLLSVFATTNVFAADLVNGVTQVANQVKNVGKTILITIFGVVAMFCLGFTIFKAVTAFMSYKKNHDYDVLSPILGLVGTLVCSLAATATFFGWFGL